MFIFTGPFSADGGWTLPQSTGGQCLQRVFLKDEPGLIPTRVAVTNVLATNVTEFTSFERMLRENLNNIIFFVIGGTMLSDNSATAPEFIPHHAFTDKLWDEWQSKSGAHLLQPFFLTQNDTMPGTNLLPKDLLRNDKLPGGVRVKYAQI